MCLIPQATFAIPGQTQPVARAAFPKGSLAIRIADELGRIFLDEQFAQLFPQRRQQKGNFSHCVDKDQY